MTTPSISAGAELFRTCQTSALFVTSQLRPRELKMADGLRRLGWKIGLIYYKWTPFDPDEFFDFSIEVASADEAHAAAMVLSPRITHVFSGAIDDFILHFCRQKPSPVVIDLNDVFAPSLFDYCHERFDPTREALALADGFCARDLQVKSAQHVDGFVLPPKLMLFPEYCWNRTTIQPKSAKRLEDDEIHVVSVGTFSLETQGMYDSCYLQLARMLVDQKIHFHIYPHWAYRRDHSGSPHAQFEKDFADFIALEKDSNYLHLHDSLPIDELAKVLPDFDFGIVSGGCADFGQKLGFYHTAYLETCYSGRISDYLDARLPALINDEVKFDFWLLKRYGACVDLKGVLKPGFKDALLKLKRDPRQEQAMDHAAWKLSVDDNSPRLATFYKEVIKAGAVEVSGPKVAATELVCASSPGGNLIKRNVDALHRHLRWASPRIAKIALPYRAIRMFEVRLHNSLQENQTHRATIATLRSQMAALEHKTAELNSQVLGLESSNAALCSRGIRLEQEKNAFESQLVAREEDAAILLGQMVNLENSKSTLENQLAWLEEEKGALLAEVVDLARKTAELSSQVLGLEVSNAALCFRGICLEQEKNAFESQLVAREEDAAILLGQMVNLENSKSTLENQLALLEEEKGALAAEVVDLARKNAASYAQVGQALAVNVDLKTQLAGRESVLGEQLSRLEEKKYALTAEVSDLLSKNNALHVKTEIFEREISDLSKQVHILSNEKFILQQEAQWGKLPINDIAGVLNWPEILNDVERANGFTELVRILRLFSSEAGSVDNPSACWNLLATKNYDQVLNFGYNNFKRTIALNYFNFLVQEGDPQIRSVETLLPSEIVESCRQLAGFVPDDTTFSCQDQFSYRYFVLLLWEYAKSIDSRKYLDVLMEPGEGNPIVVPSGAQYASQDLANSLIEYYAVSESVPFDSIRTVLEIGGGYGRNVSVILALNKNIKVTMVDIPPALYIAQRYLSSVFKDRRVFKVRNFSSYEEVKTEIEAASIVFLMPHQLALMPDLKFDLSMNISSFGEMTAEQIQWYFAQLGRITSQYLYLKQWQKSTNVFDGVVLNQEDYPYPKDWREIFSRPCPVQTEFFESLHQVGRS